MPKNATKAYTVLLCFLAIAMPNNNFMMSLGVILLAILWLFSPGIAIGFKKFKKNRPAVLLAGLYILHIVWLFNTSDFSYAFKDLRIKLPLLVLPLVLGSIPISRNQIKLVFFALSIGVWFATITGYVRYFNLPDAMYDYREIVQGISHIRLSLMMVMLAMGVVFFRFELKRFWRMYALLVLVNIVVFFNVAQLATGSIILVVTAIVAIFYKIFQNYSRLVFFISLLFLGLVICFGVYYSVNYYNDYFIAKHELPDRDERTSRGNMYKENESEKWVENGHRQFDYYSDVEMVEAWNERSKMFMAVDTGNLELNYILIRYLTSKGLRKDYEGVMSLSDKDIQNVENGYPNEIYAYQSGLKLRFHSFLFGIHVYRAAGQLSGSSFMQRLMYWKVGWEIAKENWIFGVGTGDIINEIEKKHTQLHPDMDKRYWLRIHNQFLSFFATFGIMGILYFLYLFGYGFYFQKNSFLAIMFLTIAFVSCISEDTLETQAGVTFFSFFYVLLSRPFAERLNKYNK